MKEPKDFFNDPQFTAYALGELEGDGRAAVETALKADAAARAAVDEIRATARLLESALAAEPEPEIVSPPLKAKHAAPYAMSHKLVHFPYWIVAGLAAACFAVMLALHEPQVVRVEERQKAAAAPAGAKQVQAVDAELKKSTAAAKPTSYAEVTFPVPSVPTGRIELQAKRPETAETDRAAALAGSVAPGQNPLSTFALDVDTASYANVRRFLQSGEMPPAEAVRIEELVNYFPYAYAAPRDNAPLAAALEVAAAPWAPAHRLVRIGLKAREVTAAARPTANPAFRIEPLDEAKKLRVEQAGGTLVTVAKDVKVQVEFNPAKVRSYRLIGYEERALKKEGFDHGAIAVGDVAAGHMATALYEIVLVGVATPAMPGVDALKYSKVESRASGVEGANSKALLTVKVRYTPIEGGASRRLEFPLTDRGAAFAEASMDFKFAAAVAGFGMILRDSSHQGGATLAGVEEWAGQGLGMDAGGYRAEFIGLVHRAEKLKE